jgi:hypothetical protein
VSDFDQPDGKKVLAHPTLEDNNFRSAAPAVATGETHDTARQR